MIDDLIDDIYDLLPHLHDDDCLREKIEVWLIENDDGSRVEDLADQFDMVYEPPEAAEQENKP